MQQNNITWSATAIKQVTNAIAYIKQDSEQNASKFNERLLSKIAIIINNPLSCRPTNTKRTTTAKSERSSYSIIECLIE